MSDQTYDAQRINREQRQFWDDAAPGWKQMWSMLERAGQPVSDRLVELARVGPGDRVLDIATGSGEPGLTAARKVGPGGLVVATDQSPAMLDLARESGLCGIGASQREICHDRRRRACRRRGVALTPHCADGA